MITLIKKYLLNKIICINLFLIIGTNSVFTIAQEMSFYQKFSTHKMGVGVIELTTNGDQKLVLVGFEKNYNDTLALNLSGLNVQKPGSEDFLNQRLKYFDPKFLLTVGKTGVQEVFSFELGNFNNQNFYKYALEDNQSLYLESSRTWFSSNPSSLPKSLIKIKSVKTEVVSSLIIDSLLKSASFSPLAPLATLITKLRKYPENEKNWQAQYFSGFLQQTLSSNNDHPLLSILNSQEILHLGAALHQRFNPAGLVGSLFITDNNQINIYDEYLDHLGGIKTANMTKLINLANETGLVVVPFNENVAMLYMDKAIDYSKVTLPPSTVPSFNLTKIKLKNQKIQNENLIPLGLFTFGNSAGPVVQVEFAKIPLPVERIVKNFLLTKDLALDFLGMSQVHIIMDLVVGTFKFISKKNGSLVFENAISSHAQLQFLIDSQSVPFNVDESLIAVLSGLLKEYGVKDDIIVEYEKRLKDAAGNVVQVSIIANEIMAAINLEKLKLFTDFSLDQDSFIFNKIFHWYQFKNYMKSKKLKNSLIEEIQNREKSPEHSFKRKPASDPGQYFDAKATKPVIVFLVDGLRPDRFKVASQQGLLPNINHYFNEINHQSSANLKSIVSRSLTLPSWATILTGTEPDFHGIRSNSPMNKKTGEVLNFIDFRWDLINLSNFIKGRSYQYLEKAEVEWLPAFFGSNKNVIMNYMPINNESYYPVVKLLTSYIEDISRPLNGIYSQSLLLDQASAESAKEDIIKNPGKFNLVLNWYVSIDKFSHENHAMLDLAYKTVDQSIGMVLDAAKNDPVLKNAAIFIVSDHGHRGGIESEYSRYRFSKNRNKAEFIPNTTLNLTKFFTGDYLSNKNYHMIVKSYESPHPDHDLAFLKEYLIHPTQYRYDGKKSISRKNYFEETNIYLDTLGDGLAQVHLRKWDYSVSKKTWLLEKSATLKCGDFFQYTLPTGYQTFTYNIIEDLLSFKLQNNAITDFHSKKAFEEENRKHPVQSIAIAIKNENEKNIIYRQLNLQENTKNFRDPVIVTSKKGKALIVSREGQLKKDGIEIRYFPLKEFQCDQNNLKLEIDYSTNLPNISDPFAYPYFAVDRWINEREWIERFFDHQYPNAPFYLVRALTLDSDSPIAKKIDFQMETPDLIILANRGYNFNSGSITQGDHGGIQREEVINTLLVSTLNNQPLNTPDEPILSRDVLPTILEFAGFPKTSKHWRTEWKSFYREMTKKSE
jgi:hypothetical protein